MLDHGNAVWRYTQKLINSDTSDMKIPEWYSQFKDQILENLHDKEIIRLYNIYHDCGKHVCRTVDENGKVHYPNHAEASKQAWLEAMTNNYEECSGGYNNGCACMKPEGHDGHCGPPKEYNISPRDRKIGDLIGMDMIMHTETFEQIKERNLPIQDVITLLITALAEIHANAEMFGGIESTSFKIKWKKIDKIGKRLCDHYFNHGYMYVIVRKDLSSAQKAVQSSHACIESARNYIKPEDEHPSVIICEVKSEDKLKMIMQELDSKGIEFKAFQEPDIGNQFTALATKPLYGDERDCFKRFQLIS